MEKDGQYGKVKADVQVQLVNLLGLDKQLADSNKPKLPASTQLVNQLVLQYLSWAGFKFTEVIFSAGTI